jgi:single-strand DNA-binding protein
MLNVVALMGRLVYEPELKTTPSGINVCSFRIACDRSFARQGEERKSDFIDVTAWRQTAEFVCKYFQKGSMIAIEGSLQTTSYQDKNGNNRTKVEVVASNVSFCGSKAAERAVVKDFDQQTANHVQEAKAAQLRRPNRPVLPARAIAPNANHPMVSRSLSPTQKHTILMAFPSLMTVTTSPSNRCRCAIWRYGRSIRKEVRPWALTLLAASLPSRAA